MLVLLDLRNTPAVIIDELLARKEMDDLLNNGTYIGMIWHVVHSNGSFIRCPEANDPVVGNGPWKRVEKLKRAIEANDMHKVMKMYTISVVSEPTDSLKDIILTVSELFWDNYERNARENISPTITLVDSQIHELRMKLQEESLIDINKVGC